MDPIEAADLAPGVTVPALGLLEFSSIALGMRAADAMVKKAPVRALVAGSVHPGKYLVLVDGDVASVEESLAAGVEAGAPALIDRLFLPDIHPSVGNAIAGQRSKDAIDTLGVIETRTTVSAIRAADAGMKGARVSLVELRLADGLGGKSILLFAGEQADVEAAVEIGVAVIESGNLVQQVVIPRLDGELAENLFGGTRFAAQWNQGEG
jgi:microcompartment protein CcmL/EutN